MTGTNVYELSYIWTVLKEKHPNSPGVIASPRGGPVATDPQSADRLHNDSHLKNKISNTDFYQRLGHTVPVSWICPDEYAAVIAVGGEGALYDLPEHGDVALAISHIYERNKGTVAAIGRGTAALLNVPASSAYASATTESESSLNLKNAECHSDVEGRKYLVEGKRMTCYSRQEEEETGGNLHPTHEGSHHGSKSTIPNAPGEASKGPAAHTRRKEQQNPEGKRSMSNYALPYDLEEELRRRGAKTECAKPFEPNVVVDGRIITAQSYPSMKRFMEEFSKCLS